jgi:ribosomal protein L11 methylase PrmA
MLEPLHDVITPKGTVILSGLLTTEVPQLRDGLLAEGWHVTTQVSQEEWAAVVCEEG